MSNAIFDRAAEFENWCSYMADRGYGSAEEVCRQAERGWLEPFGEYPVKAPPGVRSGRRDFDTKRAAVVAAAIALVRHEEAQGDWIDALWTSNSLDIPVELMALVEAVDRFEGRPGVRGTNGR